LDHTNHDSLVSGAANNGWEDGSWGIVSGETSLAHTGTVIAYERCYFFFIVAHFELL
jgi:hypothetical protein